MTDVVWGAPHALSAVHAIAGLGVPEMLIIGIVFLIPLALLAMVVGVVLRVARRR